MTPNEWDVGDRETLAAMIEGDELGILNLVRIGYPAPVAYTYEAAVHCPECTGARFGATAEGWIPEDAVDREGNGIGAIAPWDEDDTTNCDTCGVLLR